MQVIEELETTPRGFYCGSMGFIGDDGTMRLNVAIRTATFTQGVISYRVGAGIVADSDPDTEWEETLVKARAAG
jgi:anthranilate/para-aminobenzoate synthase component I